MKHLIAILALVLLAGCPHRPCPVGTVEYPLDVCMDFSTDTAQDRQNAEKNLRRLEYENELRKAYKWTEEIQ